MKYLPAYALCLVMLLINSAVTPKAFAAAAVTDISVLPGGLYNEGYGISGNGTTFVGMGLNSSYQQQAIYWSNGTGVHGLPGGTGNASRAYAVNQNGSVIVGYTEDRSGMSQITRWDNGVMQVISAVTGWDEGGATAVNTDGTVIVGRISDSTYMNATTAFRWTAATGTVPLGDLGGWSSTATGVSGDGAIVVGNSVNASFANEAFRWTQSTGMQGLGFLNSSGTKNSYASGISRDGNVIVGESTFAPGSKQAFMWTDSGHMQGLGFISGGNQSSAVATNRDGSVIVGKARDSSYNQQAFYWTQSKGMVTLVSELTAKGVDLSTWTMTGATGVDDSGNIVVGNGTNNGATTAFLANLATGGVTTPQDLSQSLHGVSNAGSQANQITTAQLGQSLFMARQINLATGSGDSTRGMSPSDLTNLSSGAGGPVSHWSLYASAGVGYGQDNDFDNHDLNGTIGLKNMLTPDLGVGVGLLGARAQSDLNFAGRSNMNALGASAIAAYTPEANGLRLYGSVFAADVTLDINRGYLNGAGVDNSRGKTDGIAYGAAGQAGWAFPVAAKTTIMPYADYRWSQTQIDGYNETGGAFAANFSDQDFRNSTGRLGVEPRYQMSPDVAVFSRLAWGHRFNGDAKTVTASVSGLTQGLGNDAGDRDWAEGTVGANWQMSDRTSFGTELTGRSGDTAEPVVSFTGSVNIKF